MESKHVCWNCGCNPAKERRERIATAVLAGIAGNSDLSGSAVRLRNAQNAVAQADALIKALDAPRETKLYADGADSERKTDLRDPLADYEEMDVNSVKRGSDNG